MTHPHEMYSDGSCEDSDVINEVKPLIESRQRKSLWSRLLGCFRVILLWLLSLLPTCEDHSDTFSTASNDIGVFESHEAVGSVFVDVLPGDGSSSAKISRTKEGMETPQSEASYGLAQTSLRSQTMLNNHSSDGCGKAFSEGKRDCQVVDRWERPDLRLNLRFLTERPNNDEATTTADLAQILDLGRTDDLCRRDLTRPTTTTASDERGGRQVQFNSPLKHSLGASSRKGRMYDRFLDGECISRSISSGAVSESLSGCDTHSLQSASEEGRGVSLF